LESDLWIDVAHGVPTNGPSATQEWQTSYPVVYGSFYKFKVRARNTVGISDYSNEIEILCAQEPDKPLAPTLVRNYDQIEITWQAPWSGGSAILSYTIEFRLNDDTSFA
jgi:hypothetical protein